MRPVLFQIGGLGVPSYLLLLVLGVCAFIWLGTLAAERRGVPRGQTALLLGVAYAASLIGARLLFVVESWALRDSAGTAAWSPAPGGFAVQGGIALALVAAAVVSWLLRLPLATVADAAVPGICLAGFSGRLGCFLEGCCYGRPTGLAWGMAFPDSSAPAARWGAGIAIHPTQLYEAAVFLGLAGAYLWLDRRHARAGETFLWLLAAYSIGRFVIELFRGDPRPEIWGLSLPQWLSAAFLAAALILLKARRLRDAPGTFPRLNQRTVP